MQWNQFIIGYDIGCTNSLNPFPNFFMHQITKFPFSRKSLNQKFRKLKTELRNSKLLSPKSKLRVSPDEVLYLHSIVLTSTSTIMSDRFSST